MKVSIYNTIEEIEALWRDFQKEADCYGFQTYEWLCHWYRVVGPALDARPCIVLVADDRNAPLLLFPLMMQNKMGLTCLAFADGRIADYNGPLVHPKYTELSGSGAFTDIWQQICRVLPPCDVIHFQKIPGIINQQMNPLLALPAVPFHENSYSLELTGSWDSYYQTRVKKRLRADSRRQRRRLSQLGDLRFVMVNYSRGISDITRTMIAQKKRRYQETNAPDLFNDPIYSQFYLQVSRGLMTSGHLHLSALMLDDTVIATHWGMIHQDRFYYLLPTFAGGDWKKYSPGRLLLEHLLEYAFKTRLKVFDFTIGGEAYKRDWCNSKLRLYEYLQVNTRRGEAYRLANRLKNFVRSRPRLRARLRFFKSPL